jgi:hypothetical protein
VNVGPVAHRNHPQIAQISRIRDTEKNRVGGGVAAPVLPQHRTYGSVYGASCGGCRSGTGCSACSLRAVFMRHTRSVFSAVPPPAFRPCSGISAFWSVLLVNIERSVSNASTGSALRPPVSRVAPAMQWTTMASADFCRPVESPYDGSSPKAGQQISQGKTRDFPPIYPPHLRQHAPDDIGLRVSLPSRPRAVASYVVRVPRTRSLPAASFRFRLAADTLAVRLGVPVIRASTGTFTRPVNSRFAFARRMTASVMTLSRHA